MVWGIFSWHCLGSLMRIPTSLSAIRYVELLGDHIHPFVLFYYLHGNGVFQQDNCTSQKSRLATGWLHEHSFDFSVTNWPLRSTDLNPIDHLWVVLEQDVKNYHTAPTNLSELWTALANIWQVIPVERFQKLVEFLPRRVTAVFKAKGSTTRYLVVISRRKQLSAFDQVFEFYRGRIVAYRDCGLSFREIGSRVGRNQKTVMQICGNWMQVGTTD
ncbi:transposable element Tcb1 transposase [Trichonephila clavipes]|nr:transposable element Tcb1 transposase [Trichonephila clavipes]